MLDEKLTYSDSGKASYVIHNKDKTSKVLFIYGLDNESTLNLSFSKIFDNTNNIYDISFCNEHRRSIPKLTFIKNATNPYPGNLCLPAHNNPGIYQGLLFIQDKNNTSIPITVTTEPKAFVATAWIIIGIISAIIIWELIHYFDMYRKVKEEAKQKVKEVALRTDLSSYGKQNYRDKYFTQYPNRQLDAYVTRRFKSSTTPKVAIIDIGTVVLGIAVGLFSSLNQPSVIGLRVFTPLDIFSLIGVGLGIGSLRELFIRPKSTD